MNTDEAERPQRMLEQAANKWRDNLGPDPIVDIPSIIRRADRKNAAEDRFNWARASATVVGVLAVSVVAWRLLTLPPQLSPASSPSAAASGLAGEPSSSAPASREPVVTDSASDDIVREGDAVTATGNIVETPEGIVFLCDVSPSRGGENPVCFGPPGVPLTGINPHDLAGSEHGGYWVTDRELVRGTWSSAGIQVTSTDSAEPTQLGRLPDTPCETPSARWPGYGDDPDAVVRADGALRTELAAHSASFGGMWLSASRSSSPVVNVVVVGVVGDLDAAQSLHTVYPYNLCLVAVEHSISSLDDVAARLNETSNDWGVDVVPACNCVMVSVTVLGEETARILAHEEAVQVAPLVRRERS